MTDIRELLAAALHRLDLAGALSSLEPNDLLPDRVEDSILDELPTEWLSSLHERIRTGAYQPVQAEPIYVPKSRFATRPAALVNIEDRIVFEALTNALRGPVAAALVDKRFLLWPRAERSKKKWAEFKRSPIKTRRHTHVVLGDVAGFYESIDHALLADSILDITGWPDISAAIPAFLTILMGRRRGLPQGLSSSDILATLYLAAVDAELAGQGLRYTRHGDDVRIGSRSYEAALVAAHAFETAIRKMEILANDSKIGVRLRENYLADLDDIDATLDSLKAAWVDLQAQIPELGDRSEVADLVTRIAEEHPEFDEVGWEWYRGDLTPDELVELIRPYLEPGDEIVAKQLLEETFRLRPGGDEDRSIQLPSERFADRFSFALSTLQASNSVFGIEFCETVLTDYPEQTKLVCTYLTSVAHSAPREVTNVCHKLLISKRAFLDWQIAWLLRTLSSVQEVPQDRSLQIAAKIVRLDRFGWLSRVEAAKFLAVSRKLPISQFNNLWTHAPVAFHTDLIECAVEAYSRRDSRFVGTYQLSRSNVVLRAVADRVAAPTQ